MWRSFLPLVAEGIKRGVVWARIGTCRVKGGHVTVHVRSGNRLQLECILCPYHSAGRDLAPVREMEGGGLIAEPFTTIDTVPTTGQ